MGVIGDFVSEYERQFDYWEASARTARGLLESELSSSGLRAIVTSRAKSVDRLLEKLQQRNRKTPYTSLAQISGDVADLAGVRVALYFPGQMDEVERIIQVTLDVQHVKRFPPNSDLSDPATGQRRRATRPQRRQAPSTASGSQVMLPDTSEFLSPTHV